MTTEMSAEQMQKCMAAGSPGGHHARLKPLVGTWKAHTRFRMTPDQPWMDSHGTAVNTEILGGRFIKTDYSGSNMGCPFQGVAHFGYDNLKQKYVGTWMDTMSTGVMINFGSCDESHKVFTLRGEQENPMDSGRKISYRAVTTIIDENKHTYQMFHPAPDGRGEFCSLEVTYTRA